MQTVINLNEIDFGFFEKLKKQYAGKDVSLTINEAPKAKENQKTVFKKLEALQKKYPPKVINPNIDIRALIDDASDPKIDLI